jgi:hypothetical protein
LTNLKITTHSGSEYLVSVKNYDAAQVNNDLNNIEINTVVFGDVILSRIDVKSVVPIIEAE